LHHDNQCQAPGRHFHRSALGGIEIGEELIVRERAELSAQVDIEVAFGKGGAYGGSCDVWNGGRGSGRKLMAYLLA
jgi:hypothetical protein